MTDVPQTPAPVARAMSNSISTADPEKTLQSAESVADSLPRFGSVTQSSNHDAGVTTDRVSAAFDGDGLIVTVTRANSSTFTLNTAYAFEDTGDIDITRSSLALWATEREWSVANTAGDGAVTLSGLTVMESNQADWLATGYWLHIAGQNLLAATPTVTGVEMGAFVDGTAIRSQPDLPDDGTATYVGSAGGFYVAQYGSALANIEEVAPGSTEIGEFEAPASLTANFADNTISGCIGCDGDTVLTGVVKDSATGSLESFSENTKYQLQLGAAQIRPDGTFRVNDLTLSNTDLHRAGVEVTEQRGSWGGKLWNVRNIPGTPRLVAGTLGSRFRFGDGTRGAFAGAFAAEISVGVREPPPPPLAPEPQPPSQ